MEMDSLSETLGFVVGGAAFLFFASAGSIGAGVVAGFLAYLFVDEYVGGDDETTETDQTWGDSTDDTSAGVLAEITVEGPEGDVLGVVPDSMEGFNERYSVRATTLHPVTVELEPTREYAPAQFVRRVAEKVGYGDSKVVNRVAPELPERVETEVKRRVRTDLDRRINADSAADSPVVGFSDVRAAADFDGFTYEVMYMPEYVKTDDG